MECIGTPDCIAAGEGVGRGAGFSKTRRRRFMHHGMVCDLGSQEGLPPGNTPQISMVGE
ncbi:MAG TPA: hypothetical protein VHR86_10280 [Armatimonadota bacterium]|nr:hypothetical protein [Armatimonadota bacterium]